MKNSNKRTYDSVGTWHGSGIPGKYGRKSGGPTQTKDINFVRRKSTNRPPTKFN